MMVGSVDVQPSVHAVLRTCVRCHGGHEGSWKGSGLPINDIVNIGISGSDLVGDGAEALARIIIRACVHLSRMWMARTLPKCCVRSAGIDLFIIAETFDPKPSPMHTPGSGM
jgi:hypothetical protein